MIVLILIILIIMCFFEYTFINEVLKQLADIRNRLTVYYSKYGEEIINVTFADGKTIHFKTKKDKP